jgi:hypothetical protein
MASLVSRVVALGGLLLVWIPVQTPREQPGPAPSGTAQIGGHVVSTDDAARPIRLAVVTLRGTDLPEPRSVITDDDGRFVFAGLATGQYSVSVSKPAYVTVEYGAARPGRPGIPISVAPGERIDGLVIRLARGAVITGVVTMPDHRPAPDLKVSAVRVDQQTPTIAATTDLFGTDDRGVYRLFGLAPGTYLVAVTPRAGPTRELVVTSTSEIDAILARLRREHSGGSPALSVPAASPVHSPETTPAPTRETVSWLPIFYPGTPSTADALPIVLKAAEERDGVDIQVEPARSAVVSGVITNADSSPIGPIALSLSSLGPSLPSAMTVPPTLAVWPATDGRFSYTAVCPGHYELVVRSLNIPPATSANSTVSPVPQMYAAADVIVGGNDVQNLALVMRPSITWRGKVMFEGHATGSSGLPAIRVDLDPTALRSGAVDLAVPGGIMGRGITGSSSASAQVKSDGTFEIGGLIPGTYRVTVKLPGSTPDHRWWLRSAISRGRDLLDTLLELKDDETPAEAVLTISDRHSELRGTLETASGHPAGGYSILVFSIDRSQWNVQGRRLQVTRSATDGSFSISDLPAGEYWLAALTDFDPENWSDPSWLTVIASSGALRVTIHDGESTVQNLRISSTPYDSP